LTLRRALALTGGVRAIQQQSLTSASYIDKDTLDKYEKQVIEQNKAAAEAQDLEDSGEDPSSDKMKGLDARILELGNAAESLRLQFDQAFEERIGAFKEKCLRVGNTQYRLQKAQKALDQLLNTVPSPAPGSPPLKAARDAVKTQQTELEERTKEKDEAKRQIPTAASLTSIPVLKSSPSTYLVAIRRAEDSDLRTWYFPYETATSGAAGEVSLADGDFVQVLDYKSTSLNTTGLTGSNTAANTVSGNYTIEGFVNTPGPQVINQTMALSRLRDMHAATDFGAQLNTWMLSRPALSGLGTDLYILPQSSVEDNGPFQDVKVADGDAFSFSTLPAVPIVFQSVARKLVQGESAAQVRARILAARTKGEVLSDRCNARIDQKVSEGGPGSGLLRNLQNAKNTWRVRTGHELPLAN
jgi:hypothetical protein